MSVDIETEVEQQIDAQLEDSPPEGMEVETPYGPMLMTPVAADPNPATDLEGAVLQGQEDAAIEYGSGPSGKSDDDAEIRIAIELKMKDLFAEQHTARRLRDVEEKAKKANNDAKKACEVQDELVKKCIDELESLYLNEPDPAKFPLFDKAKAEINGMFSKPDSIQPLPADTFEEALRRKQRDTPLASMGFKAGTLKFLNEKMGLTTAWDLVRRINEDGEQGRDFGITKGMTPLRFEDVVANLDDLTKVCQVEWDLAHPSEIEAMSPINPGSQADYWVKCNTCNWMKLKSTPGGCPEGHISGFTLAGNFDNPAEEQGE